MSVLTHLLESTRTWCNVRCNGLQQSYCHGVRERAGSRARVYVILSACLYVRACLGVRICMCVFSCVCLCVRIRVCVRACVSVGVKYGVNTVR